MEIGNSIYDLRPEEFEKLAMEILARSGFSEIRPAGRPGERDKGIDILAIQHEKPIAIQVKHRKELRPQEIERIIDLFAADETLPRNVVLVTSAKLTPAHFNMLEKLPPGLNVRLIGLDDLRKLIDKQVEVAKSFFASAQRRKTSLRRNLVYSLIGAVVSLVIGALTVISPWIERQQPLDRRIQTVENALQSIRDLESYLSTIKEDMIVTEKATKEINERYAKAKELEKLTETQIEALRRTLQLEKWWKTLLQYGLGFVLGIASSLIASIAYTHWKQKKALKPD